MAGRYVQVNWLSLNIYALNHSWLTIDYTWLRVRVIANIDSAIEAWLSNSNRHANIGSKCRSGYGGNSYSSSN
jgi:hypothetical protein